MQMRLRRGIADSGWVEGEGMKRVGKDIDKVEDSDCGEEEEWE